MITRLAVYIVVTRQKRISFFVAIIVTIMAFVTALDRVELYVILCSDDVYKQETPGTIVRPVIPYEDVSKVQQTISSFDFFCRFNTHIVLFLTILLR